MRHCVQSIIHLEIEGMILKFHWHGAVMNSWSGGALHIEESEAISRIGGLFMYIY
jgi:hypothetical protein